MKAVILFLLSAGALHATETEAEGTKWFDHRGKVVMVDEPAAAEETAPERWEPQWIAREERRDKALRGEFRHRTSRYRGYGYGYGYGDWGYYTGVSFGVRVGGGYCPPRVPCASPGVRVIIR